MVIRVEKLEDVSYRKRIPSIIENSCNSKLRYLNSKIKRSQQEADSVWDSFSETGLHESVIESIYQGRKKVVDDLCAQRDIVNDIKLNNIVYFSLDCESLDINWDYVLLCVSKFLNEGKKVGFYIDGDISKKSNDSNVNYTYSKEVLECIGRIDSLLKEFNQDGVYFNEQKRIDSYKDQGSLWSYDDVKYANERIDEIVDVINTNNLSPFEIMLFIHEYITNNFTYDSNALDGQNPRMLPGVFKNGSIVCSGYASIVKAIIDRLDNPNLKCMIVGCTLRDPTSQEELQFQYSNHCHNLVYVKDEKYGIDGFYIEDSSWDSKVKGKKDGYGISNCLYPIEDLFHHNNVEYYHKFYYSREKNLLETVVHPYFRKPSRYKNKDKIAEIVRLYKNKSKPIDIEVYSRGLKVLEPLLDIDSDMEIEKSIKTASIICDTDAISCFSRCRNRKEDR